MKVEVTQEDITAGEPLHPQQCPIARAIRRKRHTQMIVIHVTQDTILIAFHGRDLLVYYLPEPIAAWARHYDAGHHVTPVRFNVTRAKESYVPARYA